MTGGTVQPVQAGSDVTRDPRPAQRFTSGPWSFEDGDEHVKVNGYRLVTVWLGDENWDANARLIAAAPELYEALRQLASAAGAPRDDASIIPLGLLTALGRAGDVLSKIGGDA